MTNKHQFKSLQANGLDERFNQTVQTMLTKFVSKKKDDWDTYLDTCIFAYNTSEHHSTSFTPFELMFGRKAYLPVEIDSNIFTPEQLLEKWQQSGSTLDVNILEVNHQKFIKQAKVNIDEAQKKQKHYYDFKACKFKHL